MYKTLGVKWLHEALCSESAFATADREEARNPQRFIYVTVTTQFKKTTERFVILEQCTYVCTYRCT